MIDKVMSLDGGFDLLVIDDGSPDGTASVVERRRAEFPERLFMIERAGKLGLGTAYLTGFKWALERGYDYVFEMDCDFSHDPDDLIRLYEAAEKGGDVVVGSRYVSGVNVVNWPMSRLLMSYFASVYVRTITRMPVRDATAGFVCYSRRALETIDLDAVKMKGYGFQVEMKYSAWRIGLQARSLEDERRHIRRGVFRRDEAAVAQDSAQGVISDCPPHGGGGELPTSHRDGD